MLTCAKCFGRGNFGSEPCEKCSGNGYVRDPQMAELIALMERINESLAVLALGALARAKDDGYQVERTSMGIRLRRSRFDPSDGLPGAADDDLGDDPDL